MKSSSAPRAEFPECSPKIAPERRPKHLPHVSRKAIILASVGRAEKCYNIPGILSCQAICSVRMNRLSVTERLLV
jgi:hypothetical protein